MRSISRIIDEPTNLNITDDNLNYLCQFLSEAEFNHSLSGFCLVWDDVRKDKFPLIRAVGLNSSLESLSQKKISRNPIKVEKIVYRKDLESIKNVAAGFCAYNQLVVSGIGESGFSLKFFNLFLEKDLNLLVSKIKEIHERP